jgi:hypothetical protein
MIVSKAYNFLGVSSSTSDGVKVNNSHKFLNPGNIESFLWISSLFQILPKILNDVDVDLTISVMNMFGSEMNKVNCSEASMEYCSSLNRGNCWQFPQTCGGHCLSGFVGVPGAHNSICSDASIVNQTSNGRNIGLALLTGSCGQDIYRLFVWIMCRRCM